ncbi:MAG: hypothetical protein NTW01_18380, partial [Gammaproteobacteria bacterium]|nr:hypothetical protein [Gammaproteobacteria bacterium]
EANYRAFFCPVNTFRKLPKTADSRFPLPKPVADSRDAEYRALSFFVNTAAEIFFGWALVGRFSDAWNSLSFLIPAHRTRLPQAPSHSLL